MWEGQLQGIGNGEERDELMVRERRDWGCEKGDNIIGLRGKVRSQMGVGARARPEGWQLEKRQIRGSDLKERERVESVEEDRENDVEGATIILRDFLVLRCFFRRK